MFNQTNWLSFCSSIIDFKSIYICFLIYDLVIKNVIKPYSESYYEIFLVIFGAKLKHNTDEFFC